jgi:hypothetical protein
MNRGRPGPGRVGPIGKTPALLCDREAASKAAHPPIQLQYSRMSGELVVEW